MKQWTWKHPTKIMASLIALAVGSAIAGRAEQASPPNEPDRAMARRVADQHLRNGRALSKDWIYLVSASKSNVYRSISIKDRGNGLRSAWLLTTFVEPDRDAKFENARLSTIQLWYFKCADGQSALAAVSDYASDDATGVAIRTWSVDSNQIRLEDVVPGTIGEAGLLSVCGTGKR
jgi:hypothetical protein